MVPPVKGRYSGAKDAVNALDALSAYEALKAGLALVCISPFT